MSKHNGLSDTQELPIPKKTDDNRIYNNRNSEMRAGRQQTFISDGKRPSEMRDSGHRRLNPDNRQRTSRPKRRVEDDEYEYSYAPPQVGLKRATWDGEYPDEPPITTQRPVNRMPEFQEEETPSRSKKRRRKRKHGCLSKLLWAIFSLFFAVLIVYSVFSILAIRKIQYVESPQRSLNESVSQPDKKIENILLIGADTIGDEQGRADTMILLSFSRYNHSITMTSLLRDSYVNIPGYGAHKLNAAYAYGGPTLLMDTISNNYGIRIDDYLCYNFKSFISISDALGGFRVSITDEEASAINKMLQSEINSALGDASEDDLLPSGGTFILNGKQALSYARLRYVGNADFERSERQRRILNMMLEKFRMMSPPAMMKMIASGFPELSTNISSGRMYWLSLKLPVILSSYDKQSLRLPADGTFSDQTTSDGQMVLAVDFNANYDIYFNAVHE